MLFQLVLWDTVRNESVKSVPMELSEREVLDAEKIRP